MDAFERVSAFYTRQCFFAIKIDKRVIRDYNETRFYKINTLTRRVGCRLFQREARMVRAF